MRRELWSEIKRIFVVFGRKWNSRTRWRRQVDRRWNFPTGISFFFLFERNNVVVKYISTFFPAVWRNIRWPELIGTARQSSCQSVHTTLVSASPFSLALLLFSPTILTNTFETFVGKCWEHIPRFITTTGQINDHRQVSCLFAMFNAQNER